MFGENCEWEGPGYYEINRPYGQEQIEPIWCENYEDFESLIEFAKNDYCGFSNPLTWVSYYEG